MALGIRSLSKASLPLLPPAPTTINKLCALGQCRVSLWVSIALSVNRMTQCFSNECEQESPGGGGQVLKYRFLGPPPNALIHLIKSGMNLMPLVYELYSEERGTLGVLLDLKMQ